jgi:hypothetical protein
MTTPRNALSILLLCSLAAPALAENRLFPTDILEPGEVDVSLGGGVSKSETRVENTGGSFGTIWFRSKSESINERISARFGVAPNWQVGIAQGYISGGESSFETNQPSFPTGGSTNHGSWRPNVELSANYRFTADKDSRFSLVGKGTAAPSTAGHHTSSFNAALAAGWRFSPGLDGFAEYTGSFSDTGSGVAHSLAAGVRQRFGDRFALIPFVNYLRVPAGDDSFDRNWLGFGVSGHVQLATNTYLLPSFTARKTRTKDLNDPTGQATAQTQQRSQSVAASLYHLF